LGSETAPATPSFPKPSRSISSLFVPTSPQECLRTRQNPFRPDAGHNFLLNCGCLFFPLLVFAFSVVSPSLCSFTLHLFFPSRCVHVVLSRFYRGQKPPLFVPSSLLNETPSFLAEHNPANFMAHSAFSPAFLSTFSESPSVSFVSSLLRTCPAISFRLLPKFPNSAEAHSFACSFFFISYRNTFCKCAAVLFFFSSALTTTPGAFLSPRSFSPFFFGLLPVGLKPVPATRDSGLCLNEDSEQTFLSSSQVRVRNLACFSEQAEPFFRDVLETLFSSVLSFCPSQVYWYSFCW